MPLAGFMLKDAPAAELAVADWSGVVVEVAVPLVLGVLDADAPVLAD